MKFTRLCHFLVGWATLHCLWVAAATAQPLELHLRDRVESAPGDGLWSVRQRTVRWEPTHTAMVVCDMWDHHWCKGASARVAEMAPRMNEVLKAARARGVLIIHCPSGTMDFYKDTPQRRLAQAAPKVTPKVPLRGWCSLDHAQEPPLPIDDSDGGCDDEPTCQQGSPWTRQIATIEIGPNDAITDSAEAYYLMRQRGITNVIVMGVHLNMCVLGRPFAIRQLANQGLNVALMRDLTDTMYNSRRRPFVSHVAGTELMVAHVEKHWCPSLTSADFLGGEPFRFQADDRPTLTLLIGENEYHTWETLPRFGETELLRYGCHLDYVTSSTDTSDFTWANWRALARADAVLVSVRRRGIPIDMLKLLRRHLERGGGLVGIRTASHAFWVKGNGVKQVATDPALTQWPGFDSEVLGGNYHNHYPAGPPVRVTPADGAERHPLLAGVPAEFAAHGSLYRVSPLRSNVTPLLIGAIPNQPPEPVAWARTWGPARARIFYTSLGHPEDFGEAAFRRLLLNGVLWTLHRPVPAHPED